MKKVLLSNIHKYFIVDDEDYLGCLNYPWYLNANSNGIHTSINSKTTSISRYLLSYSGEFEIDHIDRNIYNNIKSNLRIATKTQNQQNRSLMCNNTSGYKGVSWQADRKQFLVMLKTKNRRIYIGRFNSAIEAAKAYNKAALEHFGEFAYLNPILEGGE